jgi:anti-sigma factor (TIGR02949 family)
MSGCEETRSRLTLYLDGELEGNERAAFEAHLNACEKCRSSFESEQRFLETIRQARPLHTIPPGLREQVRDIVRETGVSASGSPDGFFSRHRSLIGAVAAAAIILMLPIGLWLFKLRGVQTNTPSEFALMAAETHLRHVRGQLPLEIATSVPGEISNWFGNKVEFSVKLPNYQDSSGQQKLYRLEGARLVGYKEDYAAYVAYQMKGRPIGLVITSEDVAQATGGEEIKARGLTFHCDSIHGLKVITWADRGLTYALVSDLDERGQQSCVVCHQGAKDQDFIAPLKPR